MIYILDDSFTKNTYTIDLSILECNTCVRMVHACRVDEILPLLVSLKENSSEHILFLHKSFRFINHKGCHITADKNETTKVNFIQRVKDLGIPVVCFSRDLTNNPSQKTIDKLQFYDNIALFITDYLDSNHYNLDLLYWGEKSENIDLLSIANSIIDSIYEKSSFVELMADTSFIESLNKLLDEDSAPAIIQSWITEKWSKKEVKKYINSLIK